MLYHGWWRSGVENVTRKPRGKVWKPWTLSLLQDCFLGVNLGLQAGNFLERARLCNELSGV